MRGVIVHLLNCTPMLTIFHTNDFHNALDEQKANRLKALKEQSPNSLLLDAGDAIRAGNIYVHPGGEPVLRLMNRAGYDAMAMGNREFHFTSSGFRKKLGWAEFPILCANIRRARPRASLPVVPHITKTIGGLRVAIIGLTVPMITERMLARKVSSYIFDDPIETAAALVPKLREGCDLLIALTHIGLKEDRRLAETVPGIDLIVGGHTHAVIEKPEIVTGVPIVQAGYWARQVGRVEVEKIGNEVKVTGGIMEL
ncbi:MAG: metallophosphatase [Armatimonadota bacterium]|nr:metallophosphatase [Armatimonadota bacterium]